jgi:hypothetical protein
MLLCENILRLKQDFDYSLSENIIWALLTKSNNPGELTNPFNYGNLEERFALFLHPD